MERHVCAEPQLIGFSVLKLLLADTDTSGWPSAAVLGLRLVRPLEDDVDLALDAASLTDGARAHDQIRFFLTDRLQRNFRDIARSWCEQNGIRQVTVAAADHMDEGSRRFLSVLADTQRDVTVRLLAGGSRVPGADVYKPSVAEEAVLALCAASASADDEVAAGRLVQTARRYLSVGDAWTALRLLQIVIVTAPGPVVWSCLGLAHTMLGRTLDAEYCYLRWRACPEGAERAFADYALAMLYARHHPPHLLSMTTAADFLEDGRMHLDRLDPATDVDLDFYKVFNRNGFALLQFRSGDADAAIASLEAGIATLEESGSPRARMHQSVLLYNLAQVLRRTGDIPRAVRAYERLLSVDPRMPEYHMELAQCGLDLNDAQAALAPLLRARQLGPSIPEVHALLGYAYLSTGELPLAASSYAEAHRLDPFDQQLAYDYAYALAESAQGEPLAVMEGIDVLQLDEALAKDVASLRAELLVSAGKYDAARDELAAALVRVPGDGDLLTNLRLVSEAAQGPPRGPP